MQGASDLLFSLHSRGVRIWNENGQLRFQAPKGKLLADEIQQLRELKAQIMALLPRTDLAMQRLVEPRPSGSPVPLTATQSWYWGSFVQSRGGLSRRSCSVAVAIEGSLDVGLLKASLDTVVHRHESMRTRIVTVDGAFRQQIDAASEFPLEQIDLTRISVANANEELLRLAHELVDERLDLSVGPLIKARLLKMSSRDHVLFLALDHLITDGISKALVHGEIWTLYNQGIRDQPLLPEPHLQYADYAVWEQQMRPIWRKQQVPYWSNRLAGAQPIRLPRTGAPVQTGVPVSAIAHMSFGEVLCENLKDFARRERTLLSLVVLMLYVVVISRWCDQRDVLLPIVWHGRDRTELEGVVGFISNALYVRVEVKDNDTFIDLVKRVAVEFNAAYERQETGVEYLAEYGVEMIFNWRPAKHSQWSVDSAPDARHQVRLRPFQFRAIRPTVFAPLFSETANDIEVTVLYGPEVISPRTVERFGESLRQLAHAFTDNSSARVASIPISIL